MRLEAARKYVEQVGDLSISITWTAELINLVDDDIERGQRFIQWFGCDDDLMPKLEAWREECLQRIGILNKEIDIHLQVIEDIPDEISREVLLLYAEGIRKSPFKRNMRSIVQYEERGLSERNVLRHLKDKAYPFIAAAVPVYHAHIPELIEAHKAGQGLQEKYATI